jgi:hypothetical protein
MRASGPLGSAAPHPAVPDAGCVPGAGSAALTGTPAR